jgi:hypothetical protein
VLNFTIKVNFVKIVPSDAQGALSPPPSTSPTPPQASDVPLIAYWDESRLLLLLKSARLFYLHIYLSIYYILKAQYESLK